MKNNLFACFFLVFAFSNVLFAMPGKKLIQVKMPSNIDKFYFVYRDSAFNERHLGVFNPTRKDTVISVMVELQSGQVLRHSEYVDIEGKYRLVTQSFIVPDNDTLRFEMDMTWKLNLKGGVKFFIEDIINTYFEFPAATDNAFLDKAVGPSLTKSIFKDNKTSIEKSYSNGKLNQRERAILSNIANADYYCRLIFWALKNQTVNEINEDMVDLAKSQNEIQMVSSSSITQLFSGYVQYVILRDKINTKDTKNVVNAIIKLGWKKNISFAYMSYILSDIKGVKPIILAQCYSDLKAYLDGDFPLELEKLRNKILPVLKNMDKVILIATDGRQLTFKELLDKSLNNYTLIDFWASWCVPCREEAPLFEKAKADFSGKNIQFVSISTDEDSKVNDWRKALKDVGLLKATNHYKLVMPKDNLLFKSFGLPSIPRYILVNSKGEFIDPDFPRPSDPEFKKELTKIIAPSK